MTDIDAVIQVSLQQMQAGETELAAAGFDQVLQIDPNHGQVLYLKGCLMTEMGDTHAAIELFERSAEHAGDRSHLPLYNLGNAYQSIGEFGKAAQSFKAATEVDPTMADAWINLGRILDDAGSHDGAIECYDVALQIDDADPVTWSNRGNSMRSMGDLAEAEKSYRKTLEFDPDDLAANIGLGACLAACGSVLGLQMIEAAYESSGHPMALFEQATALGKLDRYADAVTAFDQLVELGMDEAPMWNNRGECLAKIERIEDSLASFDRAIEADPEFTHAYFGKARVLANAHRNDEARRVMKTYQEIATDEETNEPAVQALISLIGM